jgi:hypothetical protein
LPPASCCSFLAHSLAVKMEATCSSKLFADLQRTTKHYMLEDRTVHNRRCENLRSCIYPQNTENSVRSLFIQILKSGI